VHFSGPTEQSVGVEIGGRRVWAVLPARDGRRSADGDWLVRWPRLLRPYLNGRADVVVRALLAGDVLFEETVSLGNGNGVVSLLTEHGTPLTVDKGDHVTEMFSEVGDDVKAELVDLLARTLDLMIGNGHHAFLAYGALLGAARDGKLIGHDNDGDVVYLARATHPVDVMLESMRIEREFIAAGWDTRRMSGADFKLRPQLSDGRVIGIDVFTAFYLDGALHVLPNMVADLPLDALVPQSTIELEGRSLPAPADPAAWLEATYGPGWKVPDPAYKNEAPLWLRRRISGLVRGERKHVRYWNDFYATHASAVPPGPSAFARWVAELEPAPSRLLDIGSGTGRDSLWLAEQGFTVAGYDYARNGLIHAAAQAEERGVQADFRHLNLYDLREVLTAAALRPREQQAGVVYARFLVHALEADGRANLWRFSRNVLRAGLGRIYLEFRTEPTKHAFGRHYRNFVQPDIVVDELLRYGFAVEHIENDHGLAVHGTEDPRTCRIVAKLEATG
jgi:SAM-dependent methyltransferase